MILAPLATSIGQVKKLNLHTGKAEAIKEGRTLYLQYGCSGCHGVMGGGGMAVPIIDDVWKFGSDDEPLFKLIKGEIAESTMPKVLGTLEDDQIPFAVGCPQQQALPQGGLERPRGPRARPGWHSP